MRSDKIAGPRTVYAGWRAVSSALTTACRSAMSALAPGVPAAGDHGCSVVGDPLVWMDITGHGPALRGVADSRQFEMRIGDLVRSIPTVGKAVASSRVTGAARPRHHKEQCLSLARDGAICGGTLSRLCPNPEGRLGQINDGVRAALSASASRVVQRWPAR